jgi:glycosyltransferase involved in cell wall biosynthesis
VLWVVPDFPASRSDPSYVFLRLEAESLVRQPGVELRILTGSDRENDVPGLDIVRMRAPATVVQKVRLLARSLLRHPSLAVRAVRDRSRWYPALWRHDAVDHAIRAFGPAVVHSHFAFPDGSGAAELSHKHGARNVVTLRGVDTLVDWTIDYGFRLDPDYDKRYRSMLERADVITTATPEVREVAILAGARPSAVVVVPNAVTPPPPGSSPESGALRADLRLEPGALVALSVGRLVELKGFDVGVQALELLAASSDWHYVVIGEGDQRGRLEESALELGVADRLHLLGSIPHEHVWAWMAEADVYWFLSRVEAFGNVLLEAFFSGLPIVATRRGTAPALLADDPSSELISSLGPAELSEATNRVLASSEDRSRLRAARRPKRERFGAELRSTELIRLYRQS